MKNFSSVALLLIFLLIACGEKQPPPPLSSLNLSDSNTPLSDNLIPEIIKELKAINAQLKELESNTSFEVNDTSEQIENSFDNPSDTVKKPAKSSIPPEKKSTSPIKKPSNKARGQQELSKLINKLKSVPFVSLKATKIETHLTKGDTSTNIIKMWQKQPNLVKIDIIESTSGSTGVKALYNSGVGDKIKVRPAGALSFITTDLKKTDDRVTSKNDYLADDIDLVGVVRRFSSGYDAELVGKSKVSGQSVLIIKLTAKGTNTMDPKIVYEHIGFEPGSYKIRLWEMFDKPETKKPYFRMIISEIDYPSSLPDSAFKL